MSATTPPGVGAYVRVGESITGRIVDTTTRNGVHYWIVKTARFIMLARTEQIQVRD